MATLRLTFSFSAPAHACIFAAIVIFVTIIVFFYRERYIDGEQHRLRFLYILFVFVLSMLVLIFSGSTRAIILGWDGLGLSSFYLVAYYFRRKASGSRLITVLRNRVGDVFVLIFIVLTLALGSESFSHTVWGPGVIG